MHRSFWNALFVVYFTCFVFPIFSFAAEKSSSNSWIERPWDTRYFIKVDASDQLAYMKKMAMRDNAKPNQTNFDWMEFFSPTTVISVKPHWVLSDQSISVVTINFDRDGWVTTSNTYSGALRGRLNQFRHVGLAEGDVTSRRFFDIAHWFTGLGDLSAHWAPAFCDGGQQPDPALVKSELYLYGKFFKPNGLAPLFGCREWAYQLYDNERPYIDVTSYEPTSKGKAPKPYIRAFTGWARFGDHKPVIGQHEGDWYCLHDCPGDDKPGRIEDIHQWARRFNWAVPKPPTKVPTFPDPPAEPGTYR